MIIHFDNVFHGDNRGDAYASRNLGGPKKPNHKDGESLDGLGGQQATFVLKI